MAEHSRALDATRARVTADLAAREKALEQREAAAADAAGRGEAERRKRRADGEQARHDINAIGVALQEPITPEADAVSRSVMGVAFFSSAQYARLRCLKVLLNPCRSTSALPRDCGSWRRRLQRRVVSCRRARPRRMRLRTRQRACGQTLRTRRLPQSATVQMRLPPRRSGLR